MYELSNKETSYLYFPVSMINVSNDLQRSVTHVIITDEWTDEREPGDTSDH